MMESIDPSDPCSAYLIKYNQNSMLLCSILVDSMIGWCVVLCYNLSGKFTENTCGKSIVMEIWKECILKISVLSQSTSFLMSVKTAHF